MKKQFFTLLILTFLIGSVFVVTFLLKPIDTAATLTANTADHVKISLMLADTPALQVQGLSGRRSLGATEGMLFVFDKDDRQGIWMKDMNFPIDIMWLDTEMRVVSIEAGAAPSSYPRVFYPTAPARYVLEVNDHFTRDHAITLGTRFVFTKNSPQ